MLLFFCNCLSRWKSLLYPDFLSCTFLRQVKKFSCSISQWQPQVSCNYCQSNILPIKVQALDVWKYDLSLVMWALGFWIECVLNKQQENREDALDLLNLKDLLNKNHKTNMFCLHWTSMPDSGISSSRATEIT